MKANDCFNEDSLTMSIDIETNQWYNAEGLLSATDDIDEVLTECGFVTSYQVTFIKLVVALLKNTKPSAYKVPKEHNKKYMVFSPVFFTYQFSCTLFSSNTYSISSTNLKGYLE